LAIAANCSSRRVCEVKLSVTRRLDVRAGAGGGRGNSETRSSKDPAPLASGNVSRSTWSDPDRHTELVSGDRTFSDQVSTDNRTLRNGRGTRPAGSGAGAGAFQAMGSTCDGGEPPRCGSNGGPGNGREIPSRRLHATPEHQLSGIQRGALEDPPV